ncbi:Uncharacterised protein [Legionella pneumophila]|nr:Uncharacterised protein [Legionella pneumophila]CZG66901.1 Uncharacterised protein [Legionella pneumophila]CZG86744.1 Uncharacterised protein [Legionella pneumophila]CZG88951.1 Uncharacterised protein [Legionella pneumophila]CZG94782.1 Uncharacterised protein [Legionella pneumophila]
MAFHEMMKFREKVVGYKAGDSWVGIIIIFKQG